jgi:hypothetical protein
MKQELTKHALSGFSRLSHQERSAEHLERSILYLRRYFMLVAVGAYQYQRRMAVLENADEAGAIEGDTLASQANETTVETFQEWWNERREIQTFFDLIQGKAAVQRAQVDKVLSAPPPQGGDSHGATEKASDQQDLDRENQLMMRFVARRSGMVLTIGSIIKVWYMSIHTYKHTCLLPANLARFRAVGQYTSSSNMSVKNKARHECFKFPQKTQLKPRNFLIH